IVRQYTKWDHHLEFQDNPGLMVSRALQVACSEPCGPVYLSIPREVSLAQTKSARFPTLAQLGVARPPAPDPAGVRELAARLVRAENPVVVVARSGRNPATVAALVRFAELLGLPVAQSAKRAYHCFPLTHPLYQSGMSLKDADAVLVLDVDIPWRIGPDGPPDSAFVAVVDVEPSKRRIPTMEFTAALRLTADSLLTLEALEAEVRSTISAADRERFAARAKRWAQASAQRRRALSEDARAQAGKTPIDGRWLSYQIGQALGDDCIVFDDTIVMSQVHDYLQCARPGSYFYNPGSSGGWAPGAALGGKLAAPDRDVVDHWRRLLHVRHVHPRAMVGGAVQCALSEHHLSEPQLFDRDAARRPDISGGLCRKGRLPWRLFRAADRFRQRSEITRRPRATPTPPRHIGP